MLPQTNRFSDLLERVIEKNTDFLKSASASLGSEPPPGKVLREAPDSVLREALSLYEEMRKRILEIEKVRQVMVKHRGKAPGNPPSPKLLGDLNEQIRTLAEELAKRSPESHARLPGTAEDAVPADRWLRDEEDRVAFTVNARLLSDLEYAPARPALKSPAQPAAPVERLVQRTGRSFTLISLHGPAPALDAILPGLRIREHDILERYSATEIRGVLTHLRPISEHEVARLIRRFIENGFADAKCLFVGIDSPAQIDIAFLHALEQTAQKMHPGECRSRSGAALVQSAQETSTTSVRGDI